MKWFSQNTLEVTLIGLIILLAAFLRLYNLSGYMQFTGDEGRDALVIREMLVNHHFTLVGPPTSAGNIHLGPLYYYMMLIPMAIFWLNPISAAAMAALIGVGTVFLVYYLTRIWFDREAALLTSLLYAISPVTITYSNFSWNPNPAPFFALLAFFSFYKAKLSGNFRWFILTGLSVSAALQMHYLTLILLPIFAILWLAELRQRGEHRYFFSGTFLGILGFLILLSPLALFDLRHSFLNLHTFLDFFTQKNSAVNFNPLILPGRMIVTYSYSLVTRYLAGFNLVVGSILGLVIILPVFVSIKKILTHEKLDWPYLALTNWLVVGIAGLTLYQGDIYDHYVLFLSPVAYLLLGGVVNLFRKNQRVYLTLGLAILIVPLNLIQNPLRYPPNNQLLRAQQIAQFVINQAGNKPFNFALLAQSDYPDGYEFYLEQYNHKPAMLPFVMTDQLYVVCEDSICKPLGNSKYEVAAFGIARIEREYTVSGLKVYKIVHTH